MKLELFLARKYLASQKGRGLSVITWIALAGVTVGVMSLVTVLAVMSGFERDLREKILGNNAHIFLSFYQDEPQTNEAWADFFSELRKFSDLKSAMPVIYGEAFFLSPSGASEGAVVKGVPRKEAKEVLELDQYLYERNWDQFQASSIFLGSGLAHRLRVHPGDRLTLLLNRGEFSPLGVVPRMKKVEVADIFHSGLTQFDAHHVYMPIEMAQEIFGQEPYQVEIRAKDVRKIAALRAQLEERFEGKAHVRDWISANQSFLSALKLEKTVMAIILGLIVLVAAFNICGSLIMVVRDKTKDIAILKSMGASDSCVLRIFFLQGLFIGSVGTFVGLVLGLLLSLFLRDWVKFPLNPEVYMIDQVPVDLRALDILGVVLGAFFITAVATLYPARLASRLKPTEGLKVE